MTGRRPKGRPKRLARTPGGGLALAPSLDGLQRREIREVRSRTPRTSASSRASRSRPPAGSRHCARRPGPVRASSPPRRCSRSSAPPATRPPAGRSRPVAARHPARPARRHRQRGRRRLRRTDGRGAPRRRGGARGVPRRDLRAARGLRADERRRAVRRRLRHARRDDDDHAEGGLQLRRRRSDQGVRRLPARGVPVDAGGADGVEGALHARGRRHVVGPVHDQQHEAALERDDRRHDGHRDRGFRRPALHADRRQVPVGRLGDRPELDLPARLPP